MTTILALLATAIMVTEGGATRVTYYGSYYRGGEVTASGALYWPDGWSLALGPELLERVRAISGEQWPTVWLCLEGGTCWLLPVTDTGGAAFGYALEVDLPDRTWCLLTGQVPAVGVVPGSIWVEPGIIPAAAG